MDNQFIPIAPGVLAIYEQELRELAKERDVEGAHIRADEILAQIVNEIGLHGITAAWNEVPKWYA